MTERRASGDFESTVQNSQKTDQVKLYYNQTGLVVKTSMPFKGISRSSKENEHQYTNFSSPPQDIKNKISLDTEDNLDTDANIYESPLNSPHHNFYGELDDVKISPDIADQSCQVY